MALTILFACVHNAGRSQIAATLFNHYVDATKARALSAGTEPAQHVHPEVVTLMAARGFDLSGQRPQRLTDKLAQQAQWLITMGCGDQCPVVPGARRDDWPLQDPKGQSPETVARIVHEIDARVRTLIAENGWGKA